MFVNRLLLLLALALTCNGVYRCDFDYGEKCFSGLPSNSLVVVTDTSDEPRLPASDVSSISLFNDQGECSFPFTVNSFAMYFCQQTDPDLPATCPLVNSTNQRINCSEGEYGYETFEANDTEVRSHKLDLTRRPLESGEHCLHFSYHLSDNQSNASIRVIIEDEFSNANTTILTVSERLENRWHEVRQDFSVANENPTIYFLFERPSPSDSLPFYIAIDQIIINDVECTPTTPPITTTSTAPSTTSTIGTVTTTTLATTTTTSTLVMTTTTTTTSTPPPTTTIGISTTMGPPTTTTTITTTTTTSTATNPPATTTTTTTTGTTTRTPNPTTSPMISTTTIPSKGASILIGVPSTLLSLLLALIYL